MLKSGERDGQSAGSSHVVLLIFIQTFRYRAEKNAELFRRVAAPFSFS
jgi:hypothetical protein